MELTDAINEHLLDADRSLYILNADTEGRRHTDVTADEVFPVLFRVADEEVAFRIIRRLNSPDFWTEAGLRTCSRLDPLYDPTRYVGLLGGVWPGLTWWYAFAAARYHPEFMVRALHASYAHYNRHPRVYNTVPGQFSEWFDGESLINRGMRLSPWEPPRFLWAAVEGVCGIMLGPEEPGIRPLIPPDWKWCAAVRVCYHGGRLTAFAGAAGRRAARLCERRLPGRQPRRGAAAGPDGQAYARATAASTPSRWRMSGAWWSPSAVAAGEAMTTPVRLAGVLKSRQTYEMRQVPSERDEWVASGAGTGRELADLGLRIEAGGYHVLEFTRHG